MKDQSHILIDADSGEVIEEDKLALTEPDTNQERQAREAVIAVAKLLYALDLIFRR